MKKHLLWVTGVVFVLASFCSMNLFAAEVGYDKGFYIASDDGVYKIKTNIQLMPQYQFVSIENQEKVNTFQIRKARIIWSGNVFYPELKYKFQFEACGGTVSTATEGVARCVPNLRDAYMDYSFNDAFAIRFGQFKPTYNREELTSSSKLQFVDRSINNEVFSYGRALGILLHGKPFDGLIEYGLYAVNDPVARGRTNFNNDFALGGRLVWNALGRHGYTMSDLKGHEDLALVLGLAAALNSPVAAGNDPTLINTSFDIALMYAGFSFLGEANYMRNQSASTNIFGFLGSVGYFLIPEHFEIALRGAAVIPKGAGTNGYETGLGLNYFFKGHNLKLQLDYSLLWNSALTLNAVNAPTNIENAGAMGAAGAGGFVQNQNDHRIRLQAQLYF